MLIPRYGHPSRQPDLSVCKAGVAGREINVQAKQPEGNLGRLKRDRIDVDIVRAAAQSSSALSSILVTATPAIARLSDSAAISSQKNQTSGILVESKFSTVGRRRLLTTLS